MITSISRRKYLSQDRVEHDVFTLLSSDGPLSAARIAQSTASSVPRVLAALDSLCSQGLIQLRYFAPGNSQNRSRCEYQLAHSGLPTVPTGPLDSVAARVHQHLLASPDTGWHIARKLGLPVQTVILGLAALEANALLSYRCVGNIVIFRATPQDEPVHA
ncbi:hypothetical protein HNR42_000380 [Deinobacterium chartae]|uniref:Uncharacterized protein n=1 Tax=Deinobacterium chartae TaxID=521158 RepID=A0A841HYF2_9DEIO|nr:hypothetical protein [Deinobacterium chartae]MBB6096968.1 hypothetical protein [Deinobacterium chartae]